jgi:hypothetical protein
MNLDVQEVLNRIHRLDELFAIYSSVARWLDGTPTSGMMKTDDGKQVSDEEVRNVITDLEQKMEKIKNTKQLLLKSKVSIEG